jgi:pyruvate-formate lyase-activating enzyme
MYKKVYKNYLTINNQNSIMEACIFRREFMLETIALDTRTMIVRSDNETDLTEIIGFINKKDKVNNIKSFLEFAERNRVLNKEFKFSREDCYDR